MNAGSDATDLEIPFRPVGEALRDFAARHPAKTAIHDLDRDLAIDFATLHRVVATAAGLLARHGVAGATGSSSYRTRASRS